MKNIPSTITKTGKKIDNGLLNVFLNGYPFVSYEDLDCNNEKEAFTATQQAALCYLNKCTREKYSAIGESGQRTLDAMNKILDVSLTINNDFNNPGLTIEMAEHKGESYAVVSMYQNKSSLIYVDIKNESIRPAPSGGTSLQPSIEPSAGPPFELSTGPSIEPSPEPSIEPSKEPNVLPSIGSSIETDNELNVQPPSVELSAQPALNLTEQSNIQNEIKKETIQDPKQQVENKLISKKLPVTGM